MDASLLEAAPRLLPDIAPALSASRSQRLLRVKRYATTREEPFLKRLRPLDPDRLIFL